MQPRPPNLVIYTGNFAICNSPLTFFLQCETIVEQNEDEIIEFFAHETDNVKDKLCSKRTGIFSTQILHTNTHF